MYYDRNVIGHSRNDSDVLPLLRPRGLVETRESITRLTVPAGTSGKYRLSQLDDYSNLPRKKFLYNPPATLSLSARVSSENLPGTWGFGLWNDPFSAGIGIKGSGFRLPALPQTAWFFFGSALNDLSFQSRTPAIGFTAAVFASARVPDILLPLAAPAMLAVPMRPLARLVRRTASKIIRDTYQPLDIQTTDWHTYRLDWHPDTTSFQIDEKTVFETHLSPHPPLGLVVWMDNQYACFSASGIVRFGTESNPQPAWMEIKDLKINATIER